jgi:hypothetical protein
MQTGLFIGYGATDSSSFAEAIAETTKEESAFHGKRDPAVDGNGKQRFLISRLRLVLEIWGEIHARPCS